jgi:hypothetical protein
MRGKDCVMLWSSAFCYSIPCPVLKLGRYWLQIWLSWLEAVGGCWMIDKSWAVGYVLAETPIGWTCQCWAVCRSVAPWDTVVRCYSMLETWWIETWGSVLISYVVPSADFRRNICVIVDIEMKLKNCPTNQLTKSGSQEIVRIVWSPNANNPFSRSPLLGYANPIHPNLVSKLRMSWAVVLFTIYVFMAWQGENARFYLHLPSTLMSS